MSRQSLGVLRAMTRNTALTPRKDEIIDWTMTFVSGLLLFRCDAVNGLITSSSAWFVASSMTRHSHNNYGMYLALQLVPTTAMLGGVACLASPYTAYATHGAFAAAAASVNGYAAWRICNKQSLF